MKTYQPPPDKAITIRALLLGAVAGGRTVINDPLFCGDTEAAIACLKALGVKFHISRERILVEGRGLRGLKAPRRALDAREAGTVARLLAGLLAGQDFPSTITGAASLRRRPMDRVAAPLTAMGAKLKTSGGRLPMRIWPAALNGVEYSMPVASAQVKSALLLAGLYASGPTVIKEPVPSRDHTERLLKYLGAGISRRDAAITLKTGALKGRAIAVPGDISAAAPFIAASLLSGNELLIKNVGLNPTRLGLVRTLKRMGAKIRVTVSKTTPEPAGSILITPADLKAVTVEAAEIPAMIDELPLLAVLAAAARGRTVIHGADELRHKESDRIESTLALLKSLGAKAAYRGGALEVTGPCMFRGASINTFGDHRIAMAGAAAGLRAAGQVKLSDTACATKSYPDFFRDFNKIFKCLK